MVSSGFSLSARLGRIGKRLRSELLTPGGSTDPEPQAGLRADGKLEEGRCQSRAERPVCGRVLTAWWLQRPGWGGVILQGLERPRAPSAAWRVIPPSPLTPNRTVPSLSLPRASALGPSCEPEFGCRNRAVESQTKARPLPGPIKPPASQLSLFPGSPISPGAPRPAAPVSQGLLNPSGPGTRRPRRQNPRRTSVEGLLSWCVPARPCALGLRGVRGNCTCRRGIVSVIHRGVWRLGVWVSGAP